MTIAVVILAAGASTRLGEPKALARIGAHTVLESLLAGALALHGSERPVIITGAHHEAILAHVLALELAVDVVRNDAWAGGRTGSVAVAATARPGLDLVIAPADVPLVPERVFVALQDTWQDAGQPAAGWLAPWIEPPPTAAERTLRGPSSGPRLFGHPVLLGHKLARQATTLPPDAPLRGLRESASPLLAVEVEDRQILDDLDSPGDLARLRRRVAGDRSGR